jgi:hypothetical protein
VVVEVDAPGGDDVVGGFDGGGERSEVEGPPPQPAKNAGTASRQPAAIEAVRGRMPRQKYVDEKEITSLTGSFANVSSVRF